MSEQEKTATAENTPKEPKKLSNLLKYLFGVGDFGFVLMSNIELFYWAPFLTDIAGFSPAIMGIMTTAQGIVDTVTSWLPGMYLNGTKAKKWGRYRSWLILLPWCVPFLFTFSFLDLFQNRTVSAIVITLAMIITHFIWNIPYVANVSLISVVGKTPNDKATLASSRATWNQLGGILFSYLGLPLATLLAQVIGERNKYAGAAFCLGILMVVGYWMHFKMTEGYEEVETAEQAEQSKQAAAKRVPVKTMFAQLFKNPQLIILIVADFAKWLVKFVTAASAIYYFRDAAGNPGLMIPYLLVIGITAAVGAYVMRYFSARLSSRTTMIISNFGMAIFLFLGYLFYANSTMVIVMMAIALFFYGMAFAAGPALYAECVVYTTWKTGKDASGWIMGLQNFPLKVASMVRGAILAACLVAAGWSGAGVLLEGKAAQGLTISLCLVPAVICLVGALLMLFCYKLTKEKIAACQAEIDARV